jgi:predicted CoA-binding protein
MIKTLVFGASLNTFRYSNLAVRRLKQKNYDVIGIGGVAGEVEGVEILTGHPDLMDIHTITMYVNPNKQSAHIEYLLSLNPKRLIFNPGAENIHFASLAKAQGIEVEYACTLVLLSMDNYGNVA